MTTPQPVRPDPQEHDDAHAVTRTDVGQETRSQDGTVSVSGLGPLSPGSLQVGSTLGPYRLIAKLGAGGMGMVFRAEHTHLGKEVALKVLPAGMTQNPAAVSRFRREMKAVGKITHQHIVQAFDAGEVGGVHYLAMECIEGTDLHKLVQERGPLSPSDAAKAIRQAALGLSAAHALKLYHRDIKPSNMLVTKGGMVKLLDLGLARLVEETAEATELTVEGAAMGTPDFMAPEQWEDSRSADARSDLYALGCTLFYLLTGRAPYQTENTRTLVNKMKAHLATPAPDLRLVRGGVSEALATIYEKLMAKDPEARYQTAAELAEALRPLASGGAAVSDLAEEETRPIHSLTGREIAPQRRWAFAVAGTGAFAVALLLIVVTIRNRDAAVTRFRGQETPTATVTPPGKDGSLASPTGPLPPEASLDGPVSSPASPDPERDLARMVLDLQGRLVIEPGFRNVSTRDDLPSSSFIVYSVEMPPGLPPLGPGSMRSLTSAHHLKGLSIPNNNVERDIDLLAAMPVLKSLAIGDAGTRADYLSALQRSGGLSHMTTGLGPTEMSWKFVKDIRSLRSLDVWTWYPPRFSDLGTVPHLRLLRIYDGSSEGQPFDLDPAVIDAVQAANPNLRIVVGPNGEPRIAGRDPVLPLVERLMSRGFVLSGDDLQRSSDQMITADSLKGMKVPTVQVFRHNGEPPLSAEDRGLLEKVTFGDYSSMIFSRQTNSDELAREIARCGQLVAVSLTDCDLTDAGLFHLASAVDIRSIELTRTRVTEKALRRFHRFHPTCEIVSDVLKIPRDYTAPLMSPADIRRELGVSIH